MPSSNNFTDIPSILSSLAGSQDTEEWKLQILFGIFGMLGTFITLASLHYRDSLGCLLFRRGPASSDDTSYEMPSQASASARQSNYDLERARSVFPTQAPADVGTVVHAHAPVRPIFPTQEEPEDPNEGAPTSTSCTLSQGPTLASNMSVTQDHSNESTTGPRLQKTWWANARKLFRNDGRGRGEQESDVEAQW